MKRREGGGKEGRKGGDEGATCMREEGEREGGS